MNHDWRVTGDQPLKRLTIIEVVFNGLCARACPRQGSGRPSPAGYLVFAWAVMLSFFRELPERNCCAAPQCRASGRSLRRVWRCGVASPKVAAAMPHSRGRVFPRLRHGHIMSMFGRDSGALLGRQRLVR